MMDSKPELYFENQNEWREWLHENHENFPQGVYLIFHKLETGIPTMRWEEAVKIASKIAEKGDTVLLAPACASFDLFENYEDRGNQFKQAVRQL